MSDVGAYVDCTVGVVDDAGDICLRDDHGSILGFIGADRFPWMQIAKGDEVRIMIVVIRKGM